MENEIEGPAAAPHPAPPPAQKPTTLQKRDKTTMADETTYGLCPSWAISLGYMGVAAGAVLSNWGSAVSSSVLFAATR